MYGKFRHKRRQQADLPPVLWKVKLNFQFLQGSPSKTFYAAPVIIGEDITFSHLSLM